QRDILAPTWSVFSTWVGRLGSRTLTDDESRLFMLSMHSVLLVFLLDSRSYQSLLRRSVRSGPLREQVRRHVIQLVRRLLAAGRRHACPHHGEVRRRRQGAPR